MDTIEVTVDHHITFHVPKLFLQRASKFITRAITKYESNPASTDTFDCGAVDADSFRVFLGWLYDDVLCWSSVPIPDNVCFLAFDLCFIAIQWRIDPLFQQVYGHLHEILDDESLDVLAEHANTLFEQAPRPTNMHRWVTMIFCFAQINPKDGSRQAHLESLAMASFISHRFDDPLRPMKTKMYFEELKKLVEHNAGKQLFKDEFEALPFKNYMMEIGDSGEEDGSSESDEGGNVDDEMGEESGDDD